MQYYNVQYNYLSHSHCPGIVYQSAQTADHIINSKVLTTTGSERCKHGMWYKTNRLSGCQIQARVLLDLTRFKKIFIQGKYPDGKWTRKPLAYRESNILNVCVILPPEICVNLVFKHTHATSSYTIRRQFVTFIYCPM